MIVVSDTTALTTLIKSGLDWLLPRLFGEILVPAAVATELLQFHSELPAWCATHEVARSPLLDRLRQEIDLGEADAIALASQLHASLILLDDKKGRRQAEAVGLTCLALPAVLVLAKRRGLISSVAEALRIVADRGRYRVADSAALILLRSVDEA